MIRVNLLQVKRKKKAKPLPAFVVLGVIMAVLTGLAVGFVFIGQSKKIDSLNSIKIANQNKIKPSFDYANIMSRIHPGDYESYFGIQEEIEGISLDKMDLISNMTYQQLKFLWEFHYGKDFRITLFNQT